MSTLLVSRKGGLSRGRLAHILNGRRWTFQLIQGSDRKGEQSNLTSHSFLLTGCKNSWSNASSAVQRLAGLNMSIFFSRSIALGSAPGYNELRVLLGFFCKLWMYSFALKREDRGRSLRHNPTLPAMLSKKDALPSRQNSSLLRMAFLSHWRSR